MVMTVQSGEGEVPEYLRQTPGAPAPVAKYGAKPLAGVIKSPGWGLGGAG